VGLEWSVSVTVDYTTVKARYHYRSADDAGRALDDTEELFGELTRQIPSAGRMVKNARLSRDDKDLYFEWRVLDGLAAEFQRMQCPTGQSFDPHADRCVSK
jgi:hypothetical protein